MVEETTKWAHQPVVCQNSSLSEEGEGSNPSKPGRGQSIQVISLAAMSNMFVPHPYCHEIESDRKARGLKVVNPLRHWVILTISVYMSKQVFVQSISNSWLTLSQSKACNSQNCANSGSFKCSSGMRKLIRNCWFVGFTAVVLHLRCTPFLERHTLQCWPQTVEISVCLNWVSVECVESSLDEAYVGEDQTHDVQVMHNRKTCWHHIEYGFDPNREVRLRYPCNSEDEELMEDDSEKKTFMQLGAQMFWSTRCASSLEKTQDAFKK